MMRKVYFPVSAMLTFLLCISICYRSAGQRPGKENGPDHFAPSSTDFSDIPRETFFNSASMTAKDGKTFKLIVIGDRLPQLFVNGEIVNKNELSNYQDEIDQLSEVIADRQKKESLRIHSRVLRIKNQILTEIVEKRLVVTPKHVKSYFLTSTFFRVNGNIQHPDIFIFFRNKYIRSADTVFYFEVD